MEKKIWNQPEMEIQVFVANEYVAACADNKWTETGCINTNTGTNTWFSNTANKTYASDNIFTYGEFLSVTDWGTHAHPSTDNKPNDSCLYIQSDWWENIQSEIENNHYTKDTTVEINSDWWGIGHHAGNSNGHVYDEIFYESHS